MALGQGLTLRLTLTCGCCGQPIDPERVEQACTAAALFGARRYAICPVCWQEVSGPWDRGYKARWTRRMRRFEARRLTG